MRAAYNGDFITNEDESQIIGINLGSDHCAEHEWGIDGIKRAFGVPSDNAVFGVKARQITKHPELVFNEIIKTKTDPITKKKLREKYYVLTMKHWDGEKMNLSRGLGVYCNGNGISSAWDEKSFCIIVTQERKAWLKELYEAFLQNDICIGIGASNNPFSRGGLTFTIVSRLPEEVKQHMYDMDEDRFKLHEAAKATGIHEILKKAGKRYFALSPRWANAEKSEVVFWLNPMDQNINNSGWFSVKELKKWAKNKGPIMMRSGK